VAEGIQQEVPVKVDLNETPPLVAPDEQEEVNFEKIADEFKVSNEVVRAETQNEARIVLLESIIKKLSSHINSQPGGNWLPAINDPIERSIVKALQAEAGESNPEEIPVKNPDAGVKSEAIEARKQSPVIKVVEPARSR